MREVSSAVVKRYHEEREKFQQLLADKLKENMADIVGKPDYSDLMLMASDGNKLPAHMCIIKQRAPGFFVKYIEPVVGNRPSSASPSKGPSKRTSSPSQPKNRAESKPIVKIPDIDFAGLRFFITSIYSDEEVLHGPEEVRKSAAKRVESSASSHSESGADGGGAASSGNESPARKMIKSTESHDSTGTYNMDASIEDNGDPGPGDMTDSSAKQESFEIADVTEPEIQMETASTQLNSCAPVESVNKDLDTEEPNLNLASQIFSVPQPPGALDSSLEEVQKPKTSFQELKSATAAEDSGTDQDKPSPAQELVLMTSFKEIAMESPVKEVMDFGNDIQDDQNSVTSPDSFNGTSSLPHDASLHGTENRVYSSESETFNIPNRSVSMQDQMMGKFIHFDDVSSLSETESSQAGRPDQIPPSQKKIFPMFIEFDNQKPIVPPRKPYSGDPNETEEEPDQFSLIGGGTFAQIRRRMSVTSLLSMDSADYAMSPTHDRFGSKGAFPPKDGEPCSKLGKDLLELLDTQKDADVTIVVDDGELKAHKCILSATCPYLNAMLATETKAGKKLELKGFCKSVVHFALSFLYGGVTSVPDDVTVWEIVAFADMLQLEDLRKVAFLHIKGKYCHFFHKPCGGCVSGTLDILPSLQTYGLNELLDKCLQWQSKHFSRIWKTRHFTNISEELQNTCFQAVLTSLRPDNCIDVLLGCEKLQATLPKSSMRSNGNSYENISNMVGVLTDTTIEYLSANFDRVITSESFLTQGRGLALNIGLLEDLLPSVVHSLTADTGCRVLIRLYELLMFLNQRIREQTMKREGFEVEWNERFGNLIRRLYELCDTHLIHCAAAVVKCDSWNLLNPTMQERIKETGLFIEIRQPRAPPPRLSSLSRTYRRSASAGVGAPRTGVPMPLSRDRSASQKRRSAPIPESESAETESAENTPRKEKATVNEQFLKEKTIPEQKEPLVPAKTAEKRMEKSAKPVSKVPSKATKPTSKKSEPIKTTATKQSIKPSSQTSNPVKSSTKTEKEPEKSIQPMHKSPEIEDLSEHIVVGLLLNLAEQAVEAKNQPALELDGMVSPTDTVILSSGHADAPEISDSESKATEPTKTTDENLQKQPKILRSLTHTVDSPKVVKPVTGGSKPPSKPVPSEQSKSSVRKSDSSKESNAAAIRKPSPKSTSSSSQKASPSSTSRENTGDSLKKQRPNSAESSSSSRATQEPRKPGTPPIKGSGIPKSPKSTRKIVSGTSQTVSSAVKTDSNKTKKSTGKSC